MSMHIYICVYMCILQVILMRFTLVMSQKKSNTLFQCMFILSNVSMIL